MPEEKWQNPYYKKRKTVLRECTLAFLGSFALSMIFFLLHELLDWEWLQTAAIIVMMPAGILMAGLLPLTVYIIYLTLKGRQWDTTYEMPAPKPVRLGSRPEYSMGGLMVLLFLLPPIGMYYLAEKLAMEHDRRLENSVAMRALGIGLLLFGIPLSGLLGWAIYDDGWKGGMSIAVAAAGALVLGGVFASAAAQVLYRTGRRIARYHQLIFVEGKTGFDALALDMQTDYGTVVKELYRMARQGLLFSCYLDFRNRELVIPVELPKQARKCPNCGGTTVKLRKISTVCSYCGRVLR